MLATTAPRCPSRLASVKNNLSSRIRCRQLSQSPSASSPKPSNATADEAQRRAYEHYRKSRKTNPSLNSERNTKIASYAAAAVIGALGATYASVPLYKMFCQATGFGGTWEFQD